MNGWSEFAVASGPIGSGEAGKNNARHLLEGGCFFDGEKRLCNHVLVREITASPWRIATLADVQKPGDES